MFDIILNELFRELGASESQQAFLLRAFIREHKPVIWEALISFLCKKVREQRSVAKKLVEEMGN